MLANLNRPDKEYWKLSSFEYMLQLLELPRLRSRQIHIIGFLSISYLKSKGVGAWDWYWKLTVTTSSPTNCTERDFQKQFPERRKKVMNFLLLYEAIQKIVIMTMKLQDFFFFSLYVEIFRNNPNKVSLRIILQHHWINPTGLA